MTRRRREEELDRDIREHLEMEVRDNIERGMTPEAARTAALRKFGNIARIKEETRTVWGWTRVQQAVQDLLYAVRALRKNPGFSAVAAITLALGIGMNAAVFGVVNTVLLKPLPYPDANRLVWIAHYNDRFKMEAVAGPDFLDWKQQAQSFEKFAGYEYFGGTVAIDGRAEQAMAIAVSDDFWGVTGAQPSPGRAFALGERGVVVLGRGIFERTLGSDPGIVGKTVKLDGRTLTVVGIMPRSFRFLFPSPAPNGLDAAEIEAYVPSNLTPANQVRGQNMTIVNVVAKLRPGVSVPQARSEIQAIQDRIAAASGIASFYKMVELRVQPLQERLVGNARRALLVLSAAVGFVLLIACANLANLLLARATSRQKEMAVRAALGAGKWRLVWQYLAEGLVLALAGGLLGLLLARVGIRAILALGPQSTPRLAETALDTRVLGFTLAVSLLTAILFALAPALSFSQGKLYDILKAGGRMSPSPMALRFRQMLVSGELALALVLLIGAGLMLKSFWKMNTRPDGFYPESIVKMTVALSGPNYRQTTQQISFLERAIENLESAPGAQAVGMGNTTFWGFLTVEGAAPYPPGQGPHARNYTRSAGYFRAVGTPLRKGRWMTDTESTPVLLVNETLARTVFGAGDPLGKRIRIAQMPPGEIVGVVADSKTSKLDADPEPEVYQPYCQSPFVRSFDLLVKMAGMPQPAVLRDLVANVDRTQPVYRVETLEQALSDSISPRRFNLFLLAVFAIVALSLGWVGVYGVMSYLVTQRTQEIGVRMALGAQRSEVLRLVVGQGMLVALAGIAIGTAASVVLTRWMASLLYDVTATDPWTFATVCAGLALAALIACWVPAMRAARVNPVIALRYE